MNDLTSLIMLAAPVVALISMLRKWVVSYNAERKVVAQLSHESTSTRNYLSSLKKQLEETPDNAARVAEVAYELSKLLECRQIDRYEKRALLENINQSPGQARSYYVNKLLSEISANVDDDATTISGERESSGRRHTAH